MLIKRKNAFFGPVAVCALLAAAAIFFQPECLAQGNYKLEASTDKQAVTEGESLTLTVTVGTDSGAIAQPREPEMPDFQIDARSSSSRVSIINGVQRVEAAFHYSLRPLKTGKLTIGKFTLDYTDASGVQRKAETEPITVEVSAEKAEEEPAPPAVESEAKKERIAEQKIISNHLIIVTAVIVSAFALIWLVIWQNSRKEKLMAAASNGSPAKLQIGPYTDGGKPEKVFETGLSSSASPRTAADPALILREILECRKAGDHQKMFMQIPRYIKTAAAGDGGGSFAELTNQEFLSRLGKFPLLGPRSAEISDMLSLCDMVNYARYSPSEHEIEKVMTNLNNLSRLFERGGN